MELGANSVAYQNDAKSDAPLHPGGAPESAIRLGCVIVTVEVHRHGTYQA